MANKETSIHEIELDNEGGDGSINDLVTMGLAEKGSIKITCTGSDFLPFDRIEPFQGELKKRTKKDIQKIIKSIRKYGFSFPFMIWNGTGHNYCLDGHGRIEALDLMRQKGYDLPMFPVVYIEAKDEAEAKNKLLRLNSQYGTMTAESVMEFAGEIELSASELALPSGKIRLSDDEDWETEAPAGEAQGKTLTVKVDELEAADLFQELTDRGYKCSIR